MIMKMSNISVEKKRILVIEDDADSLFATKKIISGAGYNVETAHDGVAGMECFDKFKFDLVITDMIMPNKEGTEVISEIRKKDPHVKIIAVSGGGYIASEFYLRVAKKLKADLALHKPFSPNDLLAAMDSLMSPSIKRAKVTRSK